MHGTVSYELWLPHRPERVWEAFTDPVALEAWKAPNDFKPEVGHEFTFRLPPSPGDDGIGYCRVVELEAPSLLVYTWRGGPYPDTEVRYEFIAERSGTRLRFRHSGFDLNDPDQRRVYR